MLRTKEYWRVNVFAEAPLMGNPAAIIFDADDLPQATMQAIAREMNLSETVFFVRPTHEQADYAVRIFTPRSELPFAGHPTLASAFAYCRRNVLTQRCIYQECGAGLVRVTREGDLLIMTQFPPRRRAASVSEEELAAALRLTEREMLGTPFEVVSTGVEWLMAPLRSYEQVARIEPDLRAIETLSRRLNVDGVIAFAPTAKQPDCRVRLRAFAPIQGIMEDPACGSGNGSVGAYVKAHQIFGGGPVRYWAEQGEEIGRPSRIFVEVDDTHVRVGGRAVLAGEGSLFC